MIEKIELDAMHEAIYQAQQAALKGEVPVGAAVIKNGEIIASAHNLCESLKDATAHAELLAIKAAQQVLGCGNLSGCSLYVTLEPCPMCTGAAMNARIEHIIFGAFDPAAGCCGSLYALPRDPRLPHKCEIYGGIMAQQCSRLLSDFFSDLRLKKTIHQQKKTERTLL